MWIACIAIVLLSCSFPARAQVIQANGQNYMSINDTAILVAGVSFARNMEVRFNGGNKALSNWKLTVQPLTAYFAAQQTSAGDIAQYGYGPNWPIQYFSIKFNLGASQNSWNDANSVAKIGVPSNVLQLSAAEITLVERSSQPIIPSDYFSLAYDLILTGSRELLILHRDNYTVVMRYRLYNSSGTLVSQSDYSHQIGLWPPWTHLPQNVNPPITNGISLINGGGNVLLNFGESVNAYATGVETALDNSLQVSSSDGKYQVTVQTLSNFFSRNGALTSLPVSKVRVIASPAATSVNSNYTPVDLSTTARTLIINNGNTQIVNNYNIKYSTKYNSNQEAFMNLTPGNYETQITYILNPL